MRWKEIVETRDKNGVWIDDNDDIHTTQHRDSAKSLGVEDTYSGSDIYNVAKPEQTRHVVDNPLQRNKQVTFNQGRQIAQRSIDAGISTIQTTVAISDLYSTQDYIHPSQAKSYMDYPRGRPLVARLDGKLTILDGNHRVLAALKSGKDKIEIDLLDKTG